MWILFLVVGLAFAIFTIFILCLPMDPSGSYIHRDGTIVEWDGDGHGRILRPDGKLEEY